MKVMNCAAYTRKSSEEGLDQAFNSLDAQRESCEAYILSQKSEGWVLVPDHYDDGGFSGGNTERPALKALLADIEAGKIQVVVVYKIDRLSRSILDFTQMIDWFDRKGVQFAAVTQRVSTTDAAGRMNLNILMSFSQYEREIAGERIRDKVAAAKRKGKYCGGVPILGYDVNPERNKLLVNPAEAKAVEFAFRRFLQLGSVRTVANELNMQGYHTKKWNTKKGTTHGGVVWNTSHLYRMLNNHTYIGEVIHKNKHYPGEHEAIIPLDIWTQTQELLKRNSNNPGKRPNERSVSTLRSVLRCGHCDGAMGVTYTNRHKRRYTYYMCSKDSKRAIHTCPIRRVSAGDIEKVVVQQMGAIFRTPLMVSNVYQKAKAMETLERERLEIQLSELEQSVVDQHEVMCLLLTGPGNKKALLAQATQRVQETQAQRDEVNQRYTSLVLNNLSEASIVESFQTMDVFWKNLHPAEQNRIVHTLIEMIEIQETGLNITFKTKGMEGLVNDLSGIACAQQQRSAQ